MFVLTHHHHYDEEPQIVGVFTTVEKAKKYVEKVMNRENLNWSEPNLVGSMWADSGSTSLFIAPVKLLDSELKD
jgi:hypothetical protein